MPTMPIKFEKDAAGREWAIFEDVPIFDEHVGDDGVRYDKRLLSRIAANNNARIEDTGDYVPVVEHHTPEDKDPQKNPAIYGYAGPFKLGKLGSRRPRWAIVARYRIARERLKDFLDRPRRSVEVWPEKRPEDRFIDPIACLGAETPRRDLGLIYSRSGSNKIRYEMAAAFPGAMNTSPATGVSPVQNAKEPAMALSPEDIAQIRDAMIPTIEMIVSQKLGGAGASQAPEAPVDPMATGGEPAPEGEPTMPTEEPSPEGEPMPEGEGDEGGEDDEATKGEFDKFCKRYSLGSDKEDIDGARRYVASMDAGTRKRFEKHCACDEKTKAMYARCCTDAKAVAYTRTAEVEVERYRRERDDVSQKYERVSAKYRKAIDDLAEVRHQLTEANAAIRYAKIDVRLADLEKQGYAFDRKQELDLLVTMPDDMVEKQFERIVQHYAKMPTKLIPQDRMAKTTPHARSVKYAKAASEAVQKLRAEGHSPEFVSVLNWMEANDTDRLPSAEDLGL